MFPQSVAAALRAIDELPAQRRFAVLGTMAELGSDEEAEHRAIAVLAQEMDIHLITVDQPWYGVEGVDAVVGIDGAVARLRELGLELAPEQLWSADGGLMRAAVNLSGCSAAFISADGLIATNHHCAYGAIQANSSVEHDYLKDGFVARSREQELPGKDLSVRVLERIDNGRAHHPEAKAF